MEQVAGGEVGERRRWVFVFRVDGDLRFISHHDTMRLFRRALARANVPVRYSEGFNPHPRISLPLPRPVGMASDAEAMVVETACDIVANETLARLDRHTPDDLRMISVRKLEAKEHLVPEFVKYRFSFDGLSDVETNSERLAARIEEVMCAASLEMKRTNAKTGLSRQIDIRPYVVNFNLAPGAIEFTLLVTGAGTAKPAEVVALFGFDTVSVNHCTRRTEVQYK